MLILSLGCRREPSPSAVFESINLKIQHSELDSAERDIELLRAVYGRKSPEWDWTFRVLQSHVYIYRREYKKTLEVLASPFPASLSSSPLAVLKSLFEGTAYRWAQQFGKAEMKFGEARASAERYHPELLPEVLNGVAGLEFQQKQYSEVIGNSRLALAMARERHIGRQEATALTRLGLVAAQLEHFDEAIEWNKAGLKLVTSLGMKDTEATIVGNLGAGYFALGDFENAKPLFRQAADQMGKRKLYDYQAHWLMDLAECYYAEGNYAAAEEILKEALAISRPLDEKSALTECLNDLAAVSLETGRLQEAEKFNNEEAEIEKAGLDQSAKLDSQLIRARIAREKKEYAAAEKLFQGVIDARAGLIPLKWEAQARLAKTLDDEGKTAAAEAQYKAAIGTIEAARAEREHEEQRFSFLSSSIEFYQDYVDFLVAHGRTEDALKVAELSRARTLLEGLTPALQAAHASELGVGPRQVAQKLKRTLLFYWMGRNRSHLWVVTPTKLNYFQLAKASEIVPLVNSYRNTVRSLRDAQDGGSEEGKRLYALLVEPAAKVLPKDGRMILLPDPGLSSLNFETLIVPGPAAHFWIEDATLTTASSLTLLAKASTHVPTHASSPGALTSSTNQKTLLLIGNTEPVEAFPALAKAKEEMQQVEHYFPGARRSVLEGKAATPQGYLKSEPGRFTYLHFVTHGMASVTRPLDSAVILSKDGDSYKLYAREIVQHHLTAELVTISACEGANGRAYSGEGLVGLSWAFLRAGAHNVVGALWEVNDSAAPQIMDVFYGEMSKGSDASSALRTAKLALLREKDQEIVFRKPNYWAAFQLYAGS